MADRFAATARAMQSKSVALDLPAGKPKPARLALDCPVEAIAGNADSIQQPSSSLALLDECFTLLDWKQDYIVSRIGKNAGQVSRALRERDGKVFDVRWLDRLDDEFWIALHGVIGKKYGITHETRKALWLRDAVGVLESIKTFLERTAVSE